MKASLRSFAAVLIFALAAACGGNPAVGTYDLDVDALMAANPLAKNLPAEQKAKMKEAMGGSIELKADQTASLHMKNPMGEPIQESGTWTLAGDQLTITGKSEGKEQSQVFTLTGNEISRSEQLAGQKIVMKFRKR